MKNPTLSSVLCLLSFVLTVASGSAAVPASISVVGHLDGVSRQTGAASSAPGSSIYMSFRLYDQPGSGRARDRNAALWGRQTRVALENGDFDIDLSDSLGTALSDMPCATLADAVDAVLSSGSSTLYLGITPENDSNAEIFPRLKLTAVPKAVLAENVRSLPKDFTATGGVFRAERLVVEQPVTLVGSATYADIALASSAQLDFKGGLRVEGPLKADSVRSVDASPGRVETEQLVSGSTALTVTGVVALAGMPVWNGSLGGSVAEGPTVAVTTVSADIDDVRCIGEVRELLLTDFANGASSGFDATGTGWNILAEEFTTVDVSSLQGVERTQFEVWRESTAMWERRTSVTGGSWMAPADCLAHFQVDLKCENSNYGACVQFYVSDSTKQVSYIDLKPNAAASLGNSNASMSQSVPILLQKGQVVKWLGYNPDDVSDTLFETTHSQVNKIVYRKFNWR